ncbi:unnamed protein product [Nesidiocoris tenuis]|uniref:Uncharacterized protein n=1 Tax=Nesidiocoris tenuis TaxID=355587 RepID=A0A6H5GBP2_9HEMI|nr:unnamed protein product [Nesidiocoris tenuis]CAA9999519.1 unnamed protein product [Nesidiocoris tenuis]
MNLESPTRSLHIMAPAGVSIESRAGDISAQCLTDLKLESLDGGVRNNIEQALTTLPSTSKSLKEPQEQIWTQYAPLWHALFSKTEQNQYFWNDCLLVTQMYRVT